MGALEVALPFPPALVLRRAQAISSQNAFVEATKFLDDQGRHVPLLFFASQIRQAVLNHVHGISVSVEHDLPDRFLDPVTLG